MDSQRNLLLIALLFVSFLLFQNWNTNKNPETGQQTTVQTTSGTDVPNASSTNTSTNIVESTNSNKLITISSDVLSLTIDTVGGDIIESKLLKYDAELNSSDPFILLQNDKDKIYVAQSGLIGAQGIDKTAQRPTYSTTAESFKLESGKDELRVPLTYTKDGIQYTKTYILKTGEYKINVEYTIKNNTDTPANVTMYAQLKQSIGEGGGSSFTSRSYTGAAYSTDDQHYEKYSFDKIKDKNLSKEFNRGWVAMLQHYFTSAWIPATNQGNHLFSRSTDNFRYIGFTAPKLTVPAGQTATTSAILWTGPKLTKPMENAAEYLDLTLDYGWLWFLAKPLHWLLTFFQSFVGNWGVAIMCLTFLVRGAMYPLTKAQYTSMAKMRLLQPKIQAMRERVGDDRQRMSQEMMALYKSEKVNPLGGCFPVILQMPIFISLYWSLMEAVGLRHAPFFGWIHDLSVQDPYYILPILMAVSMFVMQKLSPSTATDPTQQKIMKFMPIMFSIFFLFFPAGLVLYWLTSNVVSIIQQTLIYRGLEKRGLHTRTQKK